MRSSSNLQFYSIFLLILTTLTAAWPQWFPERDALVVRQDDSSSPSPSPPPSASRTVAPSASGSGSVKPSGSSSATGSNTASNTASDKGSSTKSSSTGPITDPPKTTSAPTTANHTQYGADTPAGAVVMLTPAVIAGSQFYKVGDNVTFAWNYTNLLATPTALNVVATNSLASQYYTMTANMTIGGNATNAVTWDTAAYTAGPDGLTNPLLTAEYTLVIYDADLSVSATAEPGYLQVYNQYRFGMYTSQPYKDLDDGYKCATCSGALGDVERRFLSFVFGMGIATVLGFTWFVGGTGVIW